MACFFSDDNTLTIRRGDTAIFTVESEDIPFESYDKAYFAIIKLDTLQPAIPELMKETTAVRSIQFTITKEQTELFPQPTEDYATYGYTFKLCKDTGEEDTFIPEVTLCEENKHIIVKRIPKVHVYPKVIEGLATE